MFRCSVVAGIALAALVAGPARAAAPELSVSQRLQDRREVAAGTRAQVLGFEDGRFYANGWHVTGEMGGIITPPLKLLDSVYLGVNGQWVGQATRFTSGRGYTRYDLPPIDGVRLERTDVAPDGRRGALIGLTLSNPSRHKQTVEVMVDAHSELMMQYPWGFTGTVPNASENAPDRASADRQGLVFRDTGRLTGETSNHSYTAIVGSDRRPVATQTGPGHYGPYAAGRTCTAEQTPAPMPSECDDGPFGHGTGGRLAYKVKLRGHGPTTVWIAAAGSENSPGEARREFRRLIADPERQLAEKVRSRRALARWSRLDLPGDRLLESSIDWGKQNLADLTQRAAGVDIRWTNQGKEWTHEGSLGAMRWIGAGFPDYPWLFAVDGEYTAHAAVTLGQFGVIEDHMRAVRAISDSLSNRSGVVVHEVVSDGSVWFGKDSRLTNPDGTVSYDFNTDEIVKFPAAVALIWRWTGDDRFRDEMLDFTWRNLEYVRTQLDADGDGWPEGNGNVERPGMGEEKLDNSVYYIRGLYDFADMARSAGQVTRANAAETRADALRARFEAAWWIEADQQYADSLKGAAHEKINQKHWIGVDPMEAELNVDGEFVPGLALFANGSRALATRENDCYSGERPGNQGLFHTGCGGGPTGAGEFSIFSLNSGIQAVGEGNYGRVGAGQQPRYTDANAETQFSEPATGGTPDEQPGAMPEIMPSEPAPGAPPESAGTPPNIDRCWTCRSMFMQAWGHYGTAWAAVHQQLGVRPQLGHDWLEVVPQVPEGQTRVAGEDIRLGDGSVDVAATHTGTRYTTTTDTRGAPVRTYLIGHTLPRGAHVASVQLDGTTVTSYESRTTNRGLEVRVPASPRRRHALVVNAGA
ncbi:MAG: glycogen debranching protein [Solirubrobacteraceae bacterium]